MTPVNRVLGKLPDAVSCGKGWTACCPAHEDHNPSLSITEGEDGRALVKCHRGCTFDAICTAMGLRPIDLMPTADLLPIPACSKPKSKPKSPGEIEATYDYRDENGVLVFQVVRYKPKSFRQRQPKPCGGWDWSVKGLRTIPYRLQELLADPTRVVVVAEGEKDCDNLAALGIIAICNSGGAGKWTAEHAEFLRGRLVIVLADNDDAGRDHAQKVAASLQGIAEAIRVLELPGLPAKGDASDWIAAGGTRDELAKLVSETPLWVPTDSPSMSSNKDESPVVGKKRKDDRVAIEVTPDEHIVIEEAIQALCKDANLFVRGRVLVQIVNESGSEFGIDRGGSLPHLRAIEAVNVRESLSRYAYFFKEKSNGDDEPIEIQIHPPGWCANGIANRGCWPGIRRINAITGVPVLRSDGTILNSPGYDQESEILYVSHEDFPPIPDSPTHSEAILAADRILDLVSDFPFAEKSHRSAWLSGLFTVLCRHAFNGPSPLFLFEANTRGSGKSMLADIIGEIVSGRSMPRMTCPRDDEESRKRITALAIAGDPIILMDNIASTLGSASLDAALTGTEWTDRRLGKSEMIRMPLKAVWFATGNNVTILADTTRRIVYVRLDSLEERPEERTDFKYPNLMSQVKANRASYLADALTCIRAYIAAGKPISQGKPFGSFEEWSRIVRDCICWLGLPDPTDTRSELISRNDRSAEILAGLVNGIAEIDPTSEGFNASEILQFVESDDPKYQNLRAVIHDACDGGGRKLTVRIIGNALKKYRGRVCAGRAIDCRKPGGTAKWYVRTVKAKLPENRPT